MKNLSFKPLINFNSTLFLSAGTTWACGAVMSIASAGLMMGISSPAEAQTAKKPVSCWASKAGRQYVRVSWTASNADNANRYTVKRSRNNSGYQWKSTESKHARSSIVAESQSGNMQYSVETISKSGSRATKYCGPDGGLPHIGNSSPVAVASCWANKMNDGSIFVTWTPRPNDGAVRYTVMGSRNRGAYRWMDTVGKAEANESSFTVGDAGNYRFRVRTVAGNNAYVVRDCGPNTGVAADSKLTVMPIGDSITLGATNRPAYRYPMQKQPEYKACGIDLVGTTSIKWATEEKNGNRVPPPAAYLSNYEHEHASYGEFTVGDILNKRGNSDVLEQVKNIKPDVVLLHIGTNDITKNYLKRDEFLNVSIPSLRKLINGIKTSSPTTTIFVAKVIRPGDPKFKWAVDTWNANVGKIVAETGGKTRLVDMDNIWPKYTNGPNLTTFQRQQNQLFRQWTMFEIDDGIHPSLEGSAELAKEWLKALENEGFCP